MDLAAVGRAEGHDLLEAAAARQTGRPADGDAGRVLADGHQVGRLAQHQAAVGHLPALVLKPGDRTVVVQHDELFAPRPAEQTTCNEPTRPPPVPPSRSCRNY